MDAVDLLENDPCAARRPFIPRQLRGELFGSAGDDPERRGDLVRNPHRQGSHGRRPSRALQAFVALTADIGELEAMAQQKLFALIAHGQATEAEHEPARGGDAQDQTPARPTFAVAFALGAGDGDDPPSTRGACIHTGHAGKGRACR